MSLVVPICMSGLGGIVSFGIFEDTQVVANGTRPGRRGLARAGPNRVGHSDWGVFVFSN